jgi:hypothetical protein
MRLTLTKNFHAVDHLNADVAHGVAGSRGQATVRPQSGVLNISVCDRLCLEVTA